MSHVATLLCADLDSRRTSTTAVPASKKRHAFFDNLSFIFAAVEPFQGEARTLKAHCYAIGKQVADGAELAELIRGNRVSTESMTLPKTSAPSIAASPPSRPRASPRRRWPRPRGDGRHQAPGKGGLTDAGALEEVDGMLLPTMAA